MHRISGIYNFCIFGGMIIAGLVRVPVGVADTVHCKSAVTHKAVRIIDFKNGKLQLLDRTGQRITLGLNRIANIRVDGLAALNKAEQNLAIGQASAAGQYYPTALAGADRTWLRIWIYTRLINLHVQSGNLEQMARDYCVLAGLAPRWASKAVPNLARLGARDSDQVTMAISILQQAEGREKALLVRQCLRKVRLRLAKSLGTRQIPASVTGQGAGTGGMGGGVGRRATFDSWAFDNLQNGNWRAVLNTVKRRYSTCLPGQLPQLLYWRGRAMYIKDDVQSAMLDYLRVAIEFPVSKYAPRGLYRAGRCLLEDNQQQAAKGLFNELLDNYGQDTGQVDQELDRILQSARLLVK